MTGTFLSKQHLDELDACMACMATAGSTLQQFNKETASAAGAQRARMPLNAIFAGKIVGDLWKAASNFGIFGAIEKQLQPIMVFTDRLIALADALPAADTTSLHPWLFKLSPPTGALPEAATASMTNCWRLLPHHARSLTLLADASNTSNPGYDLLRAGIYKSLPRVIDYMAVRLQLYNSLTKAFSPATVARQRKRLLRRHYLFGMVASADFYVQYRRITVLLGQISRHFAHLLNSKTPAMFSLNLQLVRVELRRVQQLCRELVALRKSQ